MSLRQSASRRLLAALGVVAALGVSGCSSGSQGSADSTAGRVAAAPAARPESRAQDSVALEGVHSASAGQLLPSAIIDRQVISHADITVRTENVGQALLAAESAATGAGGFVASERTQADVNGAPQDSTLLLRVPSASFENIVAELSKLGRLETANRSTQDVTGEVVDVSSRVRSARDAIGRIRLLLNRARDLGDVIRLESELASRPSDLEALEARQAYLADQTSLATISLTLFSPEAPAAEPDTNKDGFLAGLSSGWHALGRAATSFATVSGALLPFLALAALVGVPLALLVRASRRRRAPTAAPSSTTADA